MISTTSTSAPGTTRQEPETVEQLIRRAHASLEASGRTASASRVTRAVRRYVRDLGVEAASLIIDGLAMVDLPSVAEAFAYDIAALNNVKVGTAIPAGYAALPALSRMNLGDRA